VFTPFEKTPEIGMEYLRRFRNVEIQGRLLELLMPLYEQAKIEEQRNTPSLVVLDVAVPAEKASKPKRFILLVLATLGAFLVASLAAFFLDYLHHARRHRDQGEDEKIALIRRELSPKQILRF